MAIIVKNAIRETIEGIQDIIAFAPLLTVMCYLIAIVVQAIKLGHFPVFAQDPDPYYIIPNLYSITFYMLGLTIFSIYGWFIILVVGFLFWKNYNLNKLTAWIFFSGILLFFALIYLFPNQMAGFFD